MLNTLIRIVPPQLLSGLLTVTATITVLYRLLFGTARGMLLTTIGLYWYMEIFSISKPFSLGQLVMWFSELSAESKTGIGTSIITVVGFVIAFHSASINWKQQTRTTLRLAASEEIDHFFEEFLRTTEKINQFARSVVREVSKTTRTSDDVCGINRLIAGVPQFIDDRKRLAEMSVDVYRMAGKNGALFAPVSGVSAWLNEVEKAVSDVATDMWVHAPLISDEVPDRENKFIARITLEEWEKLVASCEKNATFISGLVGGIRGYILAPVMEINTTSVSSLIKNLSGFKKFSTEIRARNISKSKT